MSRRKTAKWTNALRGAARPISRISYLRATLNVGEYRSLISAARDNPFFAQHFHPPFPTDFGQLKTTRLFDRIGLKRELYWSTAYLLTLARSLQPALSLRRDFLRAFLQEDLKVAKNVLRELRHAHGLSLWLIKAQLLLLQTADSLEKQKMYALEVQHSSAPHGVTAFVAHFVSNRNEPAVTPNRFAEEINRLFASRTLSQGYSEYLRYLVIPYTPTALHMAHELLRQETAGTALDLYDAVVHVIGRIAALDSTEFGPPAAGCAADLLEQFDDPELLAIASTIVRQEPVPPRQALDVANRLILTGFYEQAIELVRPILRDTPDSPDALACLVHACAPLGGFPSAQSMIERLADQLARAAAGNFDRGYNPDLVDRIARNLPASSIGRALLAIRLDLLDPGSTNARHYAAVAADSSPERTPFWLNVLPEGTRRIRYATAVDHSSQVLMIKDLAKAYQASSTRLLTGLTELEHCAVEARLGLDTGASEAAIRAARQLVASDSSYHQRRGIRLLCLLLIKRQRFVEATDTLVDFFLAHRSWLDVLPVREVAEACRTSRAPELLATLSYPVLLDLNAQHMDHHIDSDRVFGFTDLLDQLQANRPTDLASRITDQRARLVHFLRYVCVPSVMDRSDRFESSKEVLEERLAVCRLLLTLDPERPDPYHTEIKDLTRRLMLRRRMRQIDQSKVYVDTDSLKRVAHKDLRDLFGRYLALRDTHRPAPIDERVLRALAERLKEEGLEAVRLMTSDSERTEVFRGLILRLRDEYVFSSEHGLDKYLSVRIRHGTLMAHLRKPLDSAHLVTPRVAGTGKYRANEYWGERVFKNDVGAQDRLVARLNQFSADYDQHLEDLKSWLTASSQAGGKSLLRFEFSSSVIEIVERETITADTSFDAFLDKTLALFGSVLDQNLVRVRQAVLAEARPKAIQMLDTLERDIQTIRVNAELGELSDAIRTARTELQVAFGRVAQWFHRGTAVSSEPFALEEAVDISIESVKTLNPKFSASVDMYPPATTLPGSLLTPLVDMFFIVLENVARHSGLSEPTATIRLTTENGTLAVSVESVVTQEVASDPAAKARLDKIRSDIRDERNAVAVRREGGTGFHKLSRILSHDFGEATQLTFGFNAHERFVVTLVARVGVL